VSALHTHYLKYARFNSGCAPRRLIYAGFWLRRKSIPWVIFHHSGIVMRCDVSVCLPSEKITSCVPLAYVKLHESKGYKQNISPRPICKCLLHSDIKTTLQNRIRLHTEIPRSRKDVKRSLGLPFLTNRKKYCR
jgi:hypothetical protein